MALQAVPTVATSRGFIVALVVLLGMLSAAAWNMQQVAALDADRAATSDRVLALFHIHRELLEAETSQRGYLLVGDASAKQAFELSRAEVLRLIDGLDATEVPDAATRERFTRLKSLAEQRIGALGEVMVVHDEAGPEAALEAVRTRIGAALMERYIALSETTIEAELQQLASIRERTARSNWYLHMLLAGGSALILLMAMMNLAGKHRDLRRQRQMSDRVEQASAQITQLNELNNNLLSCKDHEEAYKVISTSLRHLFPVTSGGVYVYRASRDLLQLQATWGEVAGAPHQTMLSDECWSLRRGRLHQHRLSSDLVCNHWDDVSGFASICVPMMALGDTVGMMFIQVTDADLEEDVFDTAGIALIGTAAAQIASAVANISLRSALKVQSVKDPLTGLFNRRYLEESLQREIIRANRSGSQLTVIMTDIDHFKDFNDIHGHQAGDQVLQRFGAVLEANVRGDDIACRYGGEEFTIVMPSADLAMGLERAESLRISVGQIAVNHMGAKLPKVSASFGVATFPQHGDSYNALLQQADQALFLAKRSGRNRVVSAD